MKQTLDVRQDGARVMWIRDGRALVGMGWKVAREALVLLRQQLDNAARCALHPETIPLGETACRFGAFELGFRHEFGNVLFLGNGKLMFDAPVLAAWDIWRATATQASLAEEHEKAEQIAKDNALLLRTGAPFGLSDNPKILEESVKIARDDRDLRRYLPGGVRSQAVLGTPTVIQGNAGQPAAPLEEILRLLPSVGVSSRQALLAKLSGKG
jgi:hypothetical protein